MNSAFVFIQIGALSGANGMREVHQALHAIPGVKTVHFVAGPTDVIAYVEATDLAGLVDAIGKMRAVRGVATTDTRIVVPM